jgi:Arc/MetJ-type ribon-helix-helix transcriptional regulator
MASRRSRISVRLDQQTQQQLDDEVNGTGKNESDIVREALHAYLRRRQQSESCLELARRHRLIGCARGLPADLSTNRKHFEGFGR